MGFYLLLLVPLGIPLVAVAWKMINRGRTRPRPVRGTGLLDRFSGPPFGTGINHRAQVISYGEHRDRQFVVFHYGYEVPDRDGPQLRRFTVVAVRTPGPCPDLAITRPTLTGEDIELESVEFNDAFQVQASDKKFAYDVLHPGMMAWLLDDGRALRMPLTFGNQDLFTYAIDQAPEDQIRAMLEYLCDVLDRVPGFVWKP